MLCSRITRRSKQLFSGKRRLYRTFSRTFASSSVRPFSFYDQTVEEYAQRPFHPLSIKYLLDFGSTVSTQKLLGSARYLHSELPIRLARPIRYMQSLPYMVLMNPHVKMVYDSYWSSFQKLRAFPPITTEADEKEFSVLLTSLVKEHTETITLWSKGLNEIFLLPNSIDVSLKKLDDFMDRFLNERIARRMLAEQHLAYHSPREGWVGIIDVNCSPAKIAETTMAQVQEICFRTFGAYPEMQLEGELDATLVYVPAHLSYMLMELFKNSVRATMEAHRDRVKTGKPLPKVVVRICNGDDITLRISDQGGGIPRDLQKFVWSYGFSSVSSSHPERANYIRRQALKKRNGDVKEQEDDTHGPSNTSKRGTSHHHDQQKHEANKEPSSASLLGVSLSSHTTGERVSAIGGMVGVPTSSMHSDRTGKEEVKSELAGYGFGLPLTRLYADYLGGQLAFHSMPGYGSDFYLSINSIADETENILI